MYIIKKNLNGMPFEEIEGGILKKSRDEIEITTVFPTKDKAKYTGNRLHAIIDDKRKECYILASSTVENTSKVQNGFITTISGDVIETINFKSIKLRDISTSVNYGDLFKTSEVMFFGYDTRDYHLGAISVTSNTGIYFKQTAAATDRYAFAEVKDGNNLFRLQRLYYSDAPDDWRWIGYSYPNGLNGEIRSLQKVNMYGWDKTLNKNYFDNAVSYLNYGKILALETVA